MDSFARNVCDAHLFYSCLMLVLRSMYRLKHTCDKRCEATDRERPNFEPKRGVMGLSHYYGAFCARPDVTTDINGRNDLSDSFSQAQLHVRVGH